MILRGPGTPMSPVLFDHGVDLLCGLRVTHPDWLIRSVMEGTRLTCSLPGVEEVLLEHP